MSQPSSDSDTDTDADANTDAPGPDEVYCRDCGAVISERAEICPECGIRQREPPSSALDEALAGGNPVLAAILSAFLPGLGQIYNRELKRGLGFIVASMLAAFSVVLFGLGIVLYPAVWLYAIYDAYNGAARFDAARHAESSPDAGDAGTTGNAPEESKATGDDTGS